MKIKHEEIKDLMTVVTLTVEPEDYQAEVEKQIVEVRKKAQMPGFRPGMMPKTLVKKMYGKGIEADVINKLLGEKLTSYCEEQKFHILGDPLPNEAKSDKIDFDAMDTFNFAFDIALSPEVEVKVDGKTKLVEYTITVTDKMVDDQVEAYTKRFGEYKPAEEGAEDKQGTIIPCKVDGELFAKVYGENNVKDEKDFRARVKADIENNMKQESKYRFGIDTKEALLKKAGEFALPEAFLKRWILETNKDAKQEEVDKEFPAMLKDLRWNLVKDSLLRKADIKVDPDEVKAYAKEVAKMQFMQYGLMHIEEKYLEDYANNMVKDEKELRGLVERVAEGKVYEYVKGLAKVETKEISYEDFGKLFA